MYIYVLQTPAIHLRTNVFKQVFCIESCYHVLREKSPCLCETPLLESRPDILAVTLNEVFTNDDLAALYLAGLDFLDFGKLMMIQRKSQ